jgi:prepilin peptidase CpaA
LNPVASPLLNHLTDYAMNTDLFLLFDALAVAITAAITDVQQRRIPNWLTYSAMVAGALLRSYFFGWHGLLTAFGGCLLAGSIVIVFYALRAMGAGDLKLLAALGSIVGPHHAIIILSATGIAGGVLALIYAACRGRLRTTLSNVGSVFGFHAWAGLQAHPELNLDNPVAIRLPYGLAIAGGTLYAFITAWGR